MTHPLANLSREELRGWIACTRHMNTLSDAFGSDDDAMLVMDELQKVAQALLDRETPTSAPSGHEEITSVQTIEPWYQTVGSPHRYADAGAMLDALGQPIDKPICVESNLWAGTAWVTRNAEGVIQFVGSSPEESAPFLAPAGAAASAGATIGATEPASDVAPCPSEAEEAAGTAPLPAATAEEEKPQPSLAEVVAESLAAQPPAPPPAEPASTTAGRAQRSDNPWTQERLALLLRIFPTIMHMDRQLELLNALPGLPIPSVNAIAVKARKLDIHRRGEPVPEEYTDAPASRTRAPQNVEPPKDAPAAEPANAASKPVVTTGFIPLTTEEMHELRERFRVKEFGAKWLADEYDMPPDKAQEIVDQLRAEQANRKAKAA